MHSQTQKQAWLAVIIEVKCGVTGPFLRLQRLLNEMHKDDGKCGPEPVASFAVKLARDWTPGRPCCTPPLPQFFQPALSPAHAGSKTPRPILISNPPFCQPGLLEELGVQYKSAAVTAVKPKEAESQAPRKKVAASTDALAELKKGILADAPELTEKAVPKKEGPKAPQAPEATKAPAKKEELKLKKVYTAPAPAPRPPPVQTTPKYGQGKVLPKVEEAVPVKVVEPLAKPVAARDIRKSPTKARPASKVVEPEPVKEAPKAKDEGVGFFGLKPAPKKEVVVPEVQPSKVVRKLPKETKGKGEKLAEKKAAPVPVKEAPKAEKKAEKKGSSKKERCGLSRLAFMFMDCSSLP